MMYLGTFQIQIHQEGVLRCVCGESWGAALPGLGCWGGRPCKTARVRALLRGCLVGVAHPRCSAATGDTDHASLTARARIHVLSRECNLAAAVLCFSAVVPLTANPHMLRGECTYGRMVTSNSCQCGFSGSNNAGPTEDQGGAGGHKGTWKQGLWQQASARAVAAGT